ncbi:MAG: hypothetical protein M3N07_03580 [Pseudomonadota bacterium]|nr:hypothetical protein [Pseudomonadota bacterium]
MLSPDILKGPRLKVERAYRHLDEFRAFTEPLHRSFYEITFDKHSIFPELQEPGLYVHYRPLQPIPELLALVVGDAAHNLRSALDHLATGICRSVKHGAKEHFPIHPKRKNLETAPVLSLIEKAIPGAKKTFLEQIRPENGPHENLWRFNDLNNDDKHNLLIPTVAITNITGINITMPGGPSFRDNLHSGDATRPQALYAVTGFLGNITVENNPTVSVDVRFGEGTPFKDEPVLPTFVQIAQVVSKTIDAFENLIVG